MRMTSTTTMVARRVAFAALVAAILVGCGGGGGPSGEPATSGSPMASATASESAPVSASAQVLTPGSAALPTDPSSVGVPGGDMPPDALLAAEGGDPVLGQLGSYVWLETGSDAPWLPGAPITVGAGEPLSVRFEPDGAVAGWRARYVPAGQTDPQGAQSLGEGIGAPAFPAPTGGSWTAEVTVDFGPDVGSASYFWRLDVR
jgi:hypothetical protein